MLEPQGGFQEEREVRDGTATRMVRSELSGLNKPSIRELHGRPNPLGGGVDLDGLSKGLKSHHLGLLVGQRKRHYRTL